jgi:hypothetical protein
MLALSDPTLYDAGITALGQGNRSPKAMMTPRDADTVEAILGAVARDCDGPPKVLEWGSGLSTLSFTRALSVEVDQFRWVTVEHDRAFFAERVAPYLGLWSESRISYVDSNEKLCAELSNDPAERGVLALVYDGGELAPFKRSLVADRHADLDEYVAGPALLDTRFDAVLVDGRKRRRCLLEASHLVTAEGIVLLHDAQRPYYQCAWSAYASSRRVGDELWIGTHRQTDFRELVPAAALAAEGFTFRPDEFE